MIKVEEASAAAEAGVREGDIITFVDDQRVEGIESLINTLKSYSPEDQVEISFIRDGSETKVKSVLKERPLRPSKFWIHKEDHDIHGDHDVFFFDKDQDVVKRKVIIIKKEINKEESEEIEMREEPSFPEIKGSELKLTGFNAFPNPTDDIINVSFVAEKSPIVVQVYDISGKEVYRKEIQDFDGYFNEDINLGKFTQGNYILYVVQNNSVFSHNIVLN